MVLDGEGNTANCNVKRVIMEGTAYRNANAKTVVNVTRRRGSAVACLRGPEGIAQNDVKKESGERAAKKAANAVIMVIVTH